MNKIEPINKQILIDNCNKSTIPQEYINKITKYLNEKLEFNSKLGISDITINLKYITRDLNISYDGIKIYLTKVLDIFTKNGFITSVNYGVGYCRIYYYPI